MSNKGLLLLSIFACFFDVYANPMVSRQFRWKSTYLNNSHLAQRSICMEWFVAVARARARERARAKEREREREKQAGLVDENGVLRNYDDHVAEWMKLARIHETESLQVWVRGRIEKGFEGEHRLCEDTCPDWKKISFFRTERFLPPVHNYITVHQVRVVGV